MPRAVYIWHSPEGDYKWIHDFKNITASELRREVFHKIILRNPDEVVITFV